MTINLIRIKVISKPVADFSREHIIPTGQQNVQINRYIYPDTPALEVLM